MTKRKLCIITASILIIILMCLHLYPNKVHPFDYSVSTFVLGDTSQVPNTIHLYIVEPDDVTDAINTLSSDPNFYYFQMDQKTLTQNISIDTKNIYWNDIQTDDLVNYDIHGYFAYLREDMIHFVPHYVKNGYEINLMKEFNNENMIPYTIRYLDDYMEYYIYDVISKQRQVGFISNEKMFSYVEMKHHHIEETKNKYINMYSCYVRTTSKGNEVKSFDLITKGSYTQLLDRYPRSDENKAIFDIYNYSFSPKQIDLGSKVKIRELEESINDNHNHSYRFLSNAKTFAGIVQFNEYGLKESTWELDASILWNFRKDSFSLKFKMEH